MKIDIIGSVASGKTTLAKKISMKYQVPYYEKDNIVWERTSNGDRKRSSEERDKIFQEIIQSNEWIVEGSPRNCLRESFDYCDFIIVLNERTHVRLYRVVKRWLLQKCGKEKYNSKPTLKFLYFNIKWVFEFNCMRKKLFAELRKYEKRTMIFSNSTKAFEFIASIY